MPQFKKGDKVQFRWDGPDDWCEYRGKKGIVLSWCHPAVGFRTLEKPFPIDETVTDYVVKFDDGTPRQSVPEAALEAA